MIKYVNTNYQPCFARICNPIRPFVSRRLVGPLGLMETPASLLIDACVLHNYVIKRLLCATYPSPSRTRDQRFIRQLGMPIIISPFPRWRRFNWTGDVRLGLSCVCGEGGLIGSFVAAVFAKLSVRVGLILNLGVFATKKELRSLQSAPLYTACNQIQWGRTFRRKISKFPHKSRRPDRFPLLPNKRSDPPSEL